MLKLDALGTSSTWTAFAMVGRYNTMRLLKRYGLVIDANEVARRSAMDAEQASVASAPWRVDRIWEYLPTAWQLTDRGRACVAAIKENARG